MEQNIILKRFLAFFKQSKLIYAITQDQGNAGRSYKTDFKVHPLCESLNYAAQIAPV